jgi:outer membrane protein, heavy metal efflux system
MFSRSMDAAIAAWMTLIACAATPVAEAAEPAPLTLAHAVEQTLARNPDLQGFAFRMRAQEARTETAALKPPLEFRPDIENVLGTGRTSGIDAMEATFALSQVIELGQKRERRVAVVDAGRGLIEVEHTAAQLDVLAEVSRRFIHVASDQEQRQLTQRATALAEETVTAAESRVAAARAPEVEVRRARITLARARVDEEHAEHELLSSRRKLAAMWGASDAAFGRVEANLFQLPEVEPFSDLLARLGTTPEFGRFASEARLRDAEIRLAESKRRADVTYLVGVRRLQETRDQAFVASMSIPLFSRQRARGAIAEAEALRAQTDVEREAHRIRAEAQLFEIYQELNHAITEGQMLRAEVLPEMEAALEATRFAFERGRYSYLEWVDAQRELVVVQRALIEASANAHLYRTEIERLTGEALPVTTR